MICYIYDNSFEGLLTAIYDSYYIDKKPDVIIPLREFQNNFIYENINIITDAEKSSKVYISIRRKISDAALENAYNAFLSEIPDISTHIYKYLVFGWKVGKEVDLYLTDSRVLVIHKAVQKILFENHRLSGSIEE